MAGGESQALLELLNKWLSSAGGKGSSFAHKLYEREDCVYLVRCSKGSPDLHLSLAAHGQRLGYHKDKAAQAAASAYQRVAQLADAEEGFDVTLKVSLEALQMLQGDALQSWLSRLACLRLILLGEPLRTLLQAVANGTSRDAPAEAMGHPTWPLLLKPQQESLTVLLPIRLSDAQDAMLLQAFAQEFAQARRSGAAGTQNAPECSYSQPLAAPFALSPEHQQLVQEAVCSVAFVYHRQHVRTPALVEQSVIQLTSFHAYLGDHVKSFKAHIHSKMRMRMNSMMHTLAMARVEP